VIIYEKNVEGECLLRSPPILHKPVFGLVDFYISNLHRDPDIPTETSYVWAVRVQNVGLSRKPR
jgi:hypothetical protein